MPTRDPIKARLTELWNYPRYSVPRRAGTQYFFWKNTGLQRQDVLYRQATLDSEPVIVLDPNTFSPDGTVAVTNWAVSHDGTLLAYALSQHGSDWQVINMRHVDPAKITPKASCGAGLLASPGPMITLVFSIIGSQIQARCRKPSNTPGSPVLARPRHTAVRRPISVRTTGRQGTAFLSSDY